MINSIMNYIKSFRIPYVNQPKHIALLRFYGGINKQR